MKYLLKIVILMMFASLIKSQDSFYVGQKLYTIPINNYELMDAFSMNNIIIDYDKLINRIFIVDSLLYNGNVIKIRDESTGIILKYNRRLGGHMRPFLDLNLIGQYKLMFLNRNINEYFILNESASFYIKDINIIDNTLSVVLDNNTMCSFDRFFNLNYGVN